VKVLNGFKLLLPEAGDIREGADIMVVSTRRFPRASTAKRRSAGQGSAGRNCRVLRSSQNQAPGQAGLIFRIREPESAGCLPGPRFDEKYTVTGSNPRRNFSGRISVADPDGRWPSSAAR
jgi:hypothetical protein